MVSRKLTAEAGSYALTGQNVSLSVSRSLNAEAGSCALTGNDANLRTERRLTAEAGTYALTGQDAALTYTPLGSYVLTASDGSYTLSGQDVAFSRGYVLRAEAGSYSLTGQDAALIYSEQEEVASAGGDPLPHIVYEKRKTKKKDRDIRETVEAAYRTLYEAPPAVRQQVAKIVKPFAEPTKAKAPTPSSVDFDRLARNINAVDRLMAAYERIVGAEAEAARLEQQQEEEAFMMLLAA